MEEHEFVSSIRRPASDLDVIRSDHVPTANEAAQAHELLTKDLQEVERYKAEIARLRQVADKLQTEMLAIEEQTVSHRTLLSASRRFPVEIWDKIFDQACDQVGPFDCFRLFLWHPNGKISAKPLKLSAVCFKWRKILFNRPHLWSSISADIYNIRRDVTGLIRLYLKNSVGHPLTIRIEDEWKGNIQPEHLDDPDFPRRHFGFGLDVFKILMEEMPRCEDLHLGVHWASIETFLEDPPASLPYTMLQSFTNETDMGLHSSLGSSWFWSSIRNAPRLRNVWALDEHRLGAASVTLRALNEYLAQLLSRVDRVFILNPDLFFVKIRSRAGQGHLATH
ncbi:hypothetical protein VNI00_005098 [Paramarasmius palmivorus]|uniref:F-box domain-containing protein n=1 Tax=Paramarasmius palmivorus TaxID=297713 RepID=A0AAW0DK70_9AGAR